MWDHLVFSLTQLRCTTHQLINIYYIYTFGQLNLISDWNVRVQCVELMQKLKSKEREILSTLGWDTIFILNVERHCC